MSANFAPIPVLVLGIKTEDFDQFIEHTANLMNENPGGTMLTKGIRDNYIHNLGQHLGSNEVKSIGQGNKPEAFAGTQANLLHTTAKAFNDNKDLEEEVFGPSSLIISASDKDEILQTAKNLNGHLTATVHGTPEDFENFQELFDILSEKVGRIIINGYPTGVAVNHAMVHGGPFPATTNSQTTSVGTMAIYRFTRPICYQDFPNPLLPPALQDENPLNITRLVNGQYQK